MNVYEALTGETALPVGIKPEIDWPERVRTRRQPGEGTSTEGETVERLLALVGELTDPAELEQVRQALDAREAELDGWAGLWPVASTEDRRARSYS